MRALAPRFSDFKSALSPPARPLPKTFRGTGERSFQQKSRGRPRLRCGESTWCVRTPQRRHPLAQVVSPALTTCRAGFVPTLEMREERQTGLRNVPQVAQSQALQPGRVASPVRWRLPLVHRCAHARVHTYTCAHRRAVPPHTIHMLIMHAGVWVPVNTHTHCRVSASIRPCCVCLSVHRRSRSPHAGLSGGLAWAPVLSVFPDPSGGFLCGCSPCSSRPGV